MIMWLDILGAVMSLLSTYYFIRLEAKAWLVSLLATSLNATLYWQHGIYADMLLESFYFLSACYGWYLWEPNEVKHDDFKPIRLSFTQHLMLLFVILGLFSLIFYFLSTLTHSDVAFLDALTTSLSLIAQFFMGYKIITTWILWLVTDLIYIFIYTKKSLPFHTILMGIYTAMAIAGYYNWTKPAKEQLSEQAA